jgi:hypothetical protein
VGDGRSGGHRRGVAEHGFDRQGPLVNEGEA